MKGPRRFSEVGLGLCEDILREPSKDEMRSRIRSLLDDEMYSSEIDLAVELRTEPFRDRLDAAAYFSSLELDRYVENLEGDVGLWTWLALYYFDQLCPANRKPGEIARWVLSSHPFRYYRHLLAGSFRIYRTYANEPKLLRVFLWGPVSEVGDYIGQVGSRQELITNRAVLQLLDRLYFDEAKGRPKKGASDRTAAGGLRHLVDYLDQLDRTYDLYSLSTETLVEFLPNPFAAWRGRA